MEQLDLYLKKLFTLKIYLNDLEVFIQNPIDLENQRIELYLVNKDIIGHYMNSKMYQEINNFIRKNNLNISQENRDINKLIQFFKSQENDNLLNYINDINDDKKDMMKLFAAPEKLRIKKVEFYNNFFIANMNLLKVLFGDGEYNINKDINPIEYGIFTKTTFIGKEGIFIVDTVKTDNQDEIKTYIYFIKYMPKILLEEFRVNKIYIFNNLNEFKDEFNNYMKGISAESYFASRNFINKGGIFNIMDNGKRIGLYIHIDRIENYIDEEETNENRNYLEKFLSYNS